MDMEKVIKGLEFTKAMIMFNPSTGEDIEPENLNEADKTTYDACVGAITLLKKQEAKPMIENEIGWNCPSCGLNLIGKTASGYPCDLIDLPEDEPIHFCPKCGQAVKLDA